MECSLHPQNLHLAYSFFSIRVEIFHHQVIPHHQSDYLSIAKSGSDRPRGGLSKCSNFSSSSDNPSPTKMIHSCIANLGSRRPEEPFESIPLLYPLRNLCPRHLYSMAFTSVSYSYFVFNFYSIPLIDIHTSL